MAISVAQKGISQVPITLLQSHSTEGVLEIAEPLLDYDATLMDTPSETFNPTTSIQLKGRGSLPTALGMVGNDGGLLATHTAIDGGKVLISRAKYTQNAKQHDEWDVDAKHYPNAAA